MTGHSWPAGSPPSVARPACLLTGVLKATRGTRSHSSEPLTLSRARTWRLALRVGRPRVPPACDSLPKRPARCARWHFQEKHVPLRARTGSRCDRGTGPDRGGRGALLAFPVPRWPLFCLLFEISHQEIPLSADPFLTDPWPWRPRSPGARGLSSLVCPCSALSKDRAAVRWHLQRLVWLTDSECVSRGSRRF